MFSIKMGMKKANVVVEKRQKIEETGKCFSSEELDISCLTETFAQED